MNRTHPLSRSGVLAGAILAASLTAACSPSTQAPAVDPSAVPTFGANDMPPGTKVLVARQGQWLPASIVQPLGEGRFLIHYDGAGDQWNEVVGPDRLKTLGPVGGGPARDYRPGEKVLVTLQGKQMLGDIVQMTGQDAWRVHYDGWGPEAAEIVGPDRLRRPFAGPSGHAVGEALQVEVNGQSLPAKVVAVTAADRWLVRFDGYGAQYDQEVGVDRIKAAPPAVAPPPPPPVVAPPPPPPVVEAPAAKPDKDKKDKPKEKPSDTVAVPAGPPAAGEQVLVNVRGAFFPATVGAAGAGGAFKVKFGAGPEEEVAADRIVRAPTAKGRFQTGQLVLVAYKGVWVPAKVQKQTGGTEYKVRFDGTGPEEDEVIHVKRLRPR